MRHNWYTQEARARRNSQLTTAGDNEPYKWWDHGACRNDDPNLWFPEWPKPNEYKEARRICNGCPVKAACLNDALERNSNYGMFGGLTPGERAKIKDRSSADGHPQQVSA